MQAQKLKNLLRKRPVKIAGVVLGSLLLLLAILLTIASIYVSNNKAQIISKIKTEFAKRVNGELSIGNVDFSVWKNFPYLTIEVQNVTVTDSSHHQPMLKAGQIYCAVNLFKLLSGSQTIERVKISNGIFHLFVDSTGFNNAYILAHKNQPGVTDSSTAKPVEIHRIQLENFQFISEDFIKRKHYGAIVKTADASIEKDDTLLRVTLQEDCLLQGLGFNVDRGIYLENANIKGRWSLVFDEHTKTLVINESPVAINDDNFKISGDFHFGGESSSFRLSAVCKSILYKEAKALLMKRTQEKIKFIDVTTPMEITASLDGKLVNGGDPVVQVVCVAKNSILITPVATFSGCNFTGVYYNRESPSEKPSDSNSVVYFKQFTGDWYGVPLRSDSIRVDNLKDPSLFFNFKTECGLQQLDDALNLKNISFDTGSAKLDLQYAGALTTGPEILANINGALHIESGSITYVPHSLQFTNCTGDVQFSDNGLNIQQLTCDYRKNHFVVTGSGEGLTHMAQGPGKSNIILNIFCPSFNIADFSKIFSAKERRSSIPDKTNRNNMAVTAIDNLLEKQDIQVNVDAKKISLNNFFAQNAKASMLFKQDDWLIQNASLSFGEGSFVISAAMHRAGNNFETSGNFSINNADVQKVFYSFGNFGQDGITSDNLKGVLTAGAQLNMLLDNKGSITPGSLQGKVNFSIRNGELLNFAPIMAIKDYALKNRDLTDIHFAEISNNLVVKQNQVIIPRMEISSTAVRIFAEGAYGIGGPTDISIQVPISNLGKNDAALVPGNKGLDAKVGPSIYLRAKTRADGKIKLGLDIFRKFRKSGVDTTAAH